VRLVVAAPATGVGLYVVDADAPGVSVHPDRVIDLTRDQARVTFADVRGPADRIAAAGNAGATALRGALPALLTIVAADMCGAGEWQLQTTTAYAQVRKQFDHPLGFFQAVKHPIVNMMLAIDQARSLVYNAACAIDSEPDAAERFARMAKASAGEMANLCSGRSVQLHGGIGFTWECDVHLWFKRQQHNQLFLGDAAHHRTHLASLWRKHHHRGHGVAEKPQDPLCESRRLQPAIGRPLVSLSTKPVARRQTGQEVRHETNDDGARRHRRRGAVGGSGSGASPRRRPAAHGRWRDPGGHGDAAQR
jgi:hypothetical protein